MSNFIASNTYSLDGLSVTGSTCDASDGSVTTVPIGRSCEAVCSQNVSAVGAVLCSSSGLQGMSYCVPSGSTAVAKQANIMEHGLSAEFDLSPSNDVLRTALCAAYALTADCNMLTDTSSSVTAATTQATSGRRLAPNMHDTGPDLLLDLDETSREDAAEPRRLVSFDVAYTIAVPVDSSVDFADILAKANSIDTA